MKTSTRSENQIIPLFVFLFFLASWLQGISQNTGISPTGSVPNASAGLDIDFTTKGFLVPRVALTGTANPAPLLSHNAGMLVYNTVTAGDVAPGLYRNDGTKWLPAIQKPGTAAGDLQYWDGSTWVLLPAGQPGQKLQLTSAGVPAWSNNGLATVTTLGASLITASTASSGGNITSDGGVAVTVRGVCWNTSPGPTTANSKTIDGSGSGSFTSNLTGLVTATTYYVRAYATNATGTSYGNEVSFVTQ